jgi:uncharacterized protein (DUF736 family)
MAYEHKENSGSVFPNVKKTSDNQPDFKGQVNVAGKLFDIAIWNKETHKGKFQSIKISEPFKKDVTKAGAYTEQVKKQVVTEDFGDLPF